MNLQLISNEGETLTIGKTIDLEKTQCKKQEYKQIFKNKGQIQVEFINKYLKNDVTPDDLMKFIVSLMCEFVGKDDVRYFDLPIVRFKNLPLGDGYYDVWKNEIAISASSFVYLDNSSPHSFLDIVDCIGHEMTHFIQFQKLFKRYLLDHRFKIERQQLFVHDDNIFDEWMLQAVRSTLDKDTARRIRGLTHEELATSVNFNKYLLDKHEKQARKGAVEFQDKIMAKWKNEPIENSKLWRNIQKVHKRGTYAKREKGILKSANKYDRVIAGKFLSFEPNLEVLKFDLKIDDVHEHIMNRSILALKELPIKDLIYSYWQAIESCNGVMITYLMDIISERLPKIKLQEVMQKTFKILCRNSSYGYGKDSAVYADILLHWTKLAPEETAYVLYKSIYNTDINCLDTYLRKMKCDDFSKEVIINLINMLLEIYEDRLNLFESERKLFQYVFEGNATINEIELKLYKEELKFLVNVCDKLLPYLSKFNYNHEIFSNYHEKFSNHIHLICKVLKPPKTILNDVNNQENEAE